MVPESFLQVRTIPHLPTTWASVQTARTSQSGSTNPRIHRTSVSFGLLDPTLTGTVPVSPCSPVPQRVPVDPYIRGDEC